MPINENVFLRYNFLRHISSDKKLHLPGIRNHSEVNGDKLSSEILQSGRQKNQKNIKRVEGDNIKIAEEVS